MKIGDKVRINLAGKRSMCQATAQDDLSRIRETYAAFISHTNNQVATISRIRNIESYDLSWSCGITTPIEWYFYEHELELVEQ
jgi:hypothetical protein